MKTIGLLVCLAACGGAPAAAPKAAPTTTAGATVSPETYAEVAAYFQKKRPLVATCYNNAITNRKLSGKAQGRVSLTMRIAADGKTQAVRVAESTLGSKDVEDCLVELVSRWVVTAPGADMDFTFSYEFRQD